ncbi:hypothetical protein DV738_g1426, partial [Chaetothyriales sp. CBS 135597]
MAKNFSNPEQTQSRAVRAKKRSKDPENHTSTERPRKRLQTQEPPRTKQAKRKRHQEDEVHLPRVSPESSPKRLRTSAAPTQKTIGEARIEFWREGGTWPTEEQETTMHRFRELVDDARARKRSQSRKRSNASLASETNPTQSTSSMSRDQKCAPYRHPLVQRQLKECGSFMDDHELGISAESEKLCQQLLKEPQSVPQNTLFSDDELFKKTCKRVKDFGLGFDRDAFNPEQLQKLQPFLGDLLADSSFFAATYQMYFPFLTSEVKCGDGELDVADRQNAYAQSVILRGLHSLFQLVDQEKELHREINGFSISHNDEDVRIWGHYAVIEGKDVKFYRHLISKFIFAPSGEGDQRWKAYKFVKNVYDLWLPKHFEKLCSVIDMLPTDLNFDVSEQDLASSRSGLSQQLEDYSFAEEGIIPNSLPSVQPITPDTTINAGSSNSKKKKKKTK